jgi:Pyruvate/2-oxoacid:ferredoxin oxidoreductase gamma subunit
VVNTVILGAFSRITRLVGIEAVVAGVMESVPTKTAENVAAARSAYEQALA